MFVLGIALLVGCGGGGGGGGGGSATTGTTAGSSGGTTAGATGGTTAGSTGGTTTGGTTTGGTTTGGTTTGGTTTGGTTTGGTTTGGTTTGGTTTGGTTTGGTTTGGGTTGGTTGGAADPIAGLNSLIRTTNPTKSELAALVADFETAFTVSLPSDGTLQTAGAIAYAGYAAATIFDIFQPSLTDIEISTLNSPGLSVAQRLRLPNIGKGDIFPANAPVEVNSLIKIVPYLGQTERLTNDSPSPVEVALAFIEARPHIDRALQLLSTVSNSHTQSIAELNPDGSETLANATAQFGQPEREALRSVLKALRAQIRVLEAYGWDQVGFNPDTEALLAYDGVFLVQGSLTRTNYTPASPFLTRVTGYTSVLSAAQTDWREAADDGTLALNSYSGRTTGDNLFGVGDYSAGLILSSATEHSEYKTYIDGEVQCPDVLLTDGSNVLAVDLSILFTTPPADLKVFFPTINTFEVQPGEYGIEIDPATSVNRTWGNIFPDGLPDTALVDRSAIMDTSWKKSDLVAFGVNVFQ